MGGRWQAAAETIAAAWLCAACGSTPEASDPRTEPDAAATDAATDAGIDAAGALDAALADADATVGDPIRIGSWNLHNFSVYGDGEWRIDAIAGEIEQLDVDLLAVQELKLETGTQGEPPQAWDALLAKLPGREGIHNPWSSFDSTVGVVFDTTTTSVTSWQTLFAGDSYAFPRPALRASALVTKGAQPIALEIIVVHLKAFQADYERRRAACKKLRQHMDAEPDARFIVIGDFNDDPYDGPADNAYLGSFLDQEPSYFFLTKSLPPESVTSLGFYHYVNGQKITGEFLDHAITNAATQASFSSASPKIHGRPASEYASYEQQYSDHFPVVVSFTR